MPEETNNSYNPTTWGRALGEDLMMPSGQLALVRRPGVQGLIAAGVLHELDSLTPIVGDLIAVADGKKKKPMDRAKKDSADVDVKTIISNPKAVADLLHVIDKVVCYTVLQPKVEMTPNDVTRRDLGAIYADMIDIEDKLFIFNFSVGGTRDVARFREESASSLGSLVNGPEDESASERGSVHPG